MTGSSSTAILISGGLDSAILIRELLRTRELVHPLYIRGGLSWERVELLHLKRYLEALQQPALRPLQVLDLPLADLYGGHWSLTGQGVPDLDSPDQAVFLPGRNVLLLAKAFVWCRLRNVHSLALAVLRGNPFPDATPAFFDAYAAAANRAIEGEILIERPYADLGKSEVLLRGQDLPLGLTFSCIEPVTDRHCGVCNKCGERRRAFALAGLVDPTEYAGDLPRDRHPAPA